MAPKRGPSSTPLWGDDVSGARIRRARVFAKLSIAEVAALVGCDVRSIGAWENDEWPPSPGNLIELGAALQVHPAAFETTSSREVPSAVPKFRATTLLARDRDKALAYAEYVYEAAVLLDPKSLSQVPKLVGMSPELAAAEAREALGIQRGPIPFNILDTLERAGVRVVHGPSDARSISAYSLADPDFPVLVASNPKDYYRQRFDVAHELGHLVMHEPSAVSSRTIELEAHRFASAFLTPSEIIRPELVVAISHRYRDIELMWNALCAVKERWGVSLESLLMTARSINILTPRTYASRYRELNDRGWYRNEPGRQSSPVAPVAFPAIVAAALASRGDQWALSSNIRVPVAAITAMATTGLG